MTAKKTVTGSYLPKRIQDELKHSGPIAKGAKGMGAKRVQEWLTLHGFGLVIDSDFGGATEVQVRAFQAAKAVPVTGIVDIDTWDYLVEPLVQAIAPLPRTGSLSATAKAVAAQHVAQHPREAGGDNCGPWVRAYLAWDGKEARWCAGFVCTALEQAGAIEGVPPPIKSSASCDTLADRAKAAGKFVSSAQIANGTTAKSTIVPGSFFLVRVTDDDWTHVGMVTKASADSFGTLEGNTNDEGSANGFEACARERNYVKKDFIVW